LASALGSAFRGVLRCLDETYRLGFRTLLVAPAVVAVAALPEFVQHVAEIRMGMFDSREAAAAVANGATRWGFGYAKIVGFVLAILLAARLWGRGGSVRALLAMRPLRLVAVVAILVALVLGGGGMVWAIQRLLPQATPFATLLSGILQLGMLVWLVGVLVEDPRASLRRALTAQWPTAALMLFLAAAAFLPAQWLHGIDHRVALGQPRAIVWPLMIFDSLVVGVMAGLVGTALAVAYRAGPTWRGWSAEQ
jgi:hypothetical protein